MFQGLNLIHLFDFYLATAFLLSTYRRVGQYRAVGRLVLNAGRWPRLLELVKQHTTIFLTWATMLPTLLAFSLCVVQMIASRWIWHHADLTITDVASHWLSFPVVVLGAAMFIVDVYGIVDVGRVDQAEMSKYFDEAEYWLKSWKAPVVRFVTLGWVNPRQMVAVEVRKALVQASELLNSTFWWVTAQIGLRVGFGLTLWLTYALTKA